jgi:UDP-glucose 4-epimerase
MQSRRAKSIFPSSAATYGDAKQMPVDENSPQIPISPYGITKMIAEHYLRFYKQQHGIDYTVLRCGDVFGPRQDPNGEAGVIAIFAAHFLRREAVRIDSDGEQTRDYVFVSDVVSANIAALTKGSGPRRAGDTREIYFNPAKAERELGWKAQVSLLDGMRATVDYIRSQGEAGV